MKKNLITMIILLLSVTTFAKGRAPGVYKMTLTEPKEFCHDIGCVVIGAGEVEVYDFPKPQLYKGKIEKSVSIAGIEIEGGTELSFAHSGQHDGITRRLLFCDLLVKDSSSSKIVTVVGAQFKANEFCAAKTSYPQYSDSNEFDYYVRGNLAKDTNVNGTPLGPKGKTSIFVRSDRFSSLDPNDHHISKGTLREDHVMIASGGEELHLQKDDRISLGMYYSGTQRITVDHQDQRTLLPGYVGSSPTYMLKDFSLVEFTSGDHQIYNGLMVQPNSKVEVYSTGQVLSAYPRRDLVQRVQKMNIGNLNFNPGQNYPVYFWPNGNIQFLHLHNNSAEGMRIVPYLSINGSFFGIDGDFGRAAYTRDGRLALLEVRRTSLPDYLKILREGNLVDATREEQRALGFSRVFPGEELIENLMKF